MVQDWITLELAIRIHNSKGDTDISEAAKKRLRCIRRWLFAVITLAFAAFTTSILVSAHMEGNQGYAFPKTKTGCKIEFALGDLFLCQVIVMILLVIWLFVETQRAVNRERRSRGRVQWSLRRERCTYAIITFFFALFYCGRFIINNRMVCATGYRSTFFIEMVWFSVFFIEGASMGVLMIFHLLNFEEGTLMTF